MGLVARVERSLDQCQVFQCLLIAFGRLSPQRLVAVEAAGIEPGAVKQGEGSVVELVGLLEQTAVLFRASCRQAWAGWAWIMARFLVEE